MPKYKKVIVHKREHPALQNLKFHHFFVGVTFALMDPDPAHQNEWRIRIHEPDIVDGRKFLLAASFLC